MIRLLFYSGAVTIVLTYLVVVVYISSAIEAQPTLWNVWQRLALGIGSVLTSGLIGALLGFGRAHLPNQSRD